MKEDIKNRGYYYGDIYTVKVPEMKEGIVR